MSGWAPVAELAASVQAGKLKAADLVEQSLKAIADNKDYDAIIATVEKRARQRAKDVDARVAKGQKVGRLAGVPFIAKDNFLAFGADTTAASNMLKGFEAPYQATAIERLEHIVGWFDHWLMGVPKPEYEIGQAGEVPMKQPPAKAPSPAAYH